jgi:uncharacterized Zn-binding protein involved in type VI secretion
VTTHESVGGALSEWQSPSQTKYPLLHWRPEGQVALPLPLGGPSQVVQLDPQCEGLSGLTQSPPHTSKLVAHAKPHVPVVHVAVAFAGTGHACPQVPQFPTALVVSTQPAFAPQ